MGSRNTEVHAQSSKPKLGQKSQVEAAQPATLRFSMQIVTVWFTRQHFSALWDMSVCAGSLNSVYSIIVGGSVLGSRYLARLLFFYR